MTARLLDIGDYSTALRTFEWKALWELVDGRAEHLNLAHECVDRHPPDAVALRIQRADGGREVHAFGALAAWSCRFAHWLEAQGVARGERVAMLALMNSAPTNSGYTRVVPTPVWLVRFLDNLRFLVACYFQRSAKQQADFIAWQLRTESGKIAPRNGAAVEL